MPHDFDKTPSTNAISPRLDLHTHTPREEPMNTDFDAAAREIAARYEAELEGLAESHELARPHHAEREAQIQEGAAEKLAVRQAVARDRAFVKKRKPTVFRPSRSTSKAEE